MTNLVGHGGTAVCSLRIHPKAASDIVIGTGAVSGPLCLVPKVNLELVLVQIGLLCGSEMSELKGLDIVFVYLFAPLQEGIRIQMIRRSTLVRGLVAKVLVPENDEVLALLAPAEIIETIRKQRIVESACNIPSALVLVELAAHINLVIVRDIVRRKDSGRHFGLRFRFGLRLHRRLVFFTRKDKGR